MMRMECFVLPYIPYPKAKQVWKFQIRRETERLLGGYLPPVRDTEKLIVPPSCYPDSGLIGSLLLAKRAGEEAQ